MVFSRFLNERIDLTQHLDRTWRADKNNSVIYYVLITIWEILTFGGIRSLVLLFELYELQLQWEDLEVLSEIVWFMRFRVSFIELYQYKTDKMVESTFSSNFLSRKSISVPPPLCQGGLKFLMTGLKTVSIEDSEYKLTVRLLHFLKSF